MLLQNSTTLTSVVFPGSGRPSECTPYVIHSLPFISIRCFWELRCLSFHHSTQSHVILCFPFLSLPQFVLLLAHLSLSDAIQLSPYPMNHLLQLPLNSPMWQIIVGGPRVCISHMAGAQWYFSIPVLVAAIAFFECFYVFFPSILWNDWRFYLTVDAKLLVWCCTPHVRRYSSQSFCSFLLRVKLSSSWFLIRDSIIWELDG